MAGSQVVIAASCIDKERIGYQAISLTHFADNSAPSISAGSKVEIGGALFEFAGDETITGLAGIANSSQIYILLTVAGASVTASGSITAPTWSATAQGWYSAAVRVIGGMFKDGSGNYTKKWLYREDSGGIQSVKEYGDGTIDITNFAISGDLSLAGFVAGAILNLYADTAGGAESSAVYVKRKEILCPISGIFTVKFDLASNGIVNAFGRIYKNGSAVGTERSQTSASFTTYSEDLAVSAGDKMQLYQHSIGAATCFTRNFRLYNSVAFPPILGALLLLPMRLLDS